MREQIKDPGRLRHIIDAIDIIQTYTDGISYEEFEKDLMRYHAVVYNIMIIGEAVYMLTPEFCAAHPETPWKQIKGMRHFLVHGYHQVEKDIVWKVIEEELVPLRKQILGYIEELNKYMLL